MQNIFLPLRKNPKKNHTVYNYMLSLSLIFRLSISHNIIVVFNFLFCADFLCFALIKNNQSKIVNYLINTIYNGRANTSV